MTSPPTQASPVLNTMLPPVAPTDVATEKTFTETLVACQIWLNQNLPATGTTPPLNAQLPIMSQGIPNMETLNLTYLMVVNQRDTMISIHPTTSHKDLITGTTCTVTMPPMTWTMIHTTLMPQWGQLGTVLQPRAACSTLRASRRQWWLNI